MKIGKNLRNLLLSQERTLKINDTTSTYMGEEYSYPKVTLKECKKIVEIIKDKLST